MPKRSQRRISNSSITKDSIADFRRKKTDFHGSRGEPRLILNLLKTQFAEDYSENMGSFTQLQPHSQNLSPKPLNVDKNKLDIIPANPLLPKTLCLDIRQPAQCPLKDIQFLKIERFKQFSSRSLVKMGEGFDQVGKMNMMRVNIDKRKQFDEEKNKRNPEEQVSKEAKMDDCTHWIQNIVYARDPKIFDTKGGLVNQRQAFQHENYLDIKAMIKD